MNIIKEQLCLVKDLGIIDYSDAYQYQMECVKHVLNDQPQTLIFCEHPPVLTLGRLGTDQHIFATADELIAQKVKVHRIDRGGEVTLHAPGQLVIYPILNLNIWKKDLRAYLHSLEEVAIDLLKEFGIVAERNSGKTGVWIHPKKIVSIGVGVKKWISYHGLAINVNTDLKLFSFIRPCGLNVSMTSMKEILGRDISLETVKNNLIKIFSKHFDLNIDE